MSSIYNAVKVTDDVYWVGAVDFSVRDFHGYLTQRGSTYNAFLIMDEKITLIDTVKAPFVDEMFSRIASVVDPSKIDVLVSNHAEMDHSGSIPETLKRINPSEVYASQMGAKALQDHFHLERQFTPVKNGSTLSLGKNTLTFLETRMIHWPDSMFSYLGEQKLLFANDAFGMHLAGSERFADEIDPCLLDYEAAKYYANILMPLSGLIGKLLEKVGEMGIEIDIVCPDHGPIWRQPPHRIIEQYAEWTRMKPSEKAIVVYDTMWKSTEKMAEAIYEGIAGAGVQAKLLKLGPCHRSDIVTDLLDAGALVVGTSTLNNNMLPAVADVLTYIKGLKPKNKVAAAFGSYGWSGEGANHVAQWLSDMKLDLVADPVTCKFVPDEAALQPCVELGRRVAERVKALCREG